MSIKNSISWRFRFESLVRIVVGSHVKILRTGSDTIHQIIGDLVLALAVFIWCTKFIEQPFIRGVNNRFRVCLNQLTRIQERLKWHGRLRVDPFGIPTLGMSKNLSDFRLRNGMFCEFTF